jgi:acyl-CoA synthetase (AMP-forming)/AMP-acid ligase II
VSAVTTNSLTAWVEAPTSHRGIRFWHDSAWQWWSYEDLARFARRTAQGLVSAGVGHDDRVLVVERTGPEFIAALYGVMIAGAIPCPVAPPHLFQNEALYTRHLHAIGTIAQPSMVITSPNLASRLPFGGPRPLVRTVTELAAGDECAPRPAASAALLQFTSGSSGRVKGVRVPVAALAANVAAIGGWLEMADGDATASWLPVHHDMGLIGCLVTPVTQQRDLWLQEPAEFIRDPARYVACFSEPGAVMTAMPTFGLDYIARRLTPQALAGSDFSRWRALIVGAERIDIDVLDRFMALMGPFGFDRRALLPAYGLAEATLAVTGLPLRTGFATVPVAAGHTSLGQRVARAGGTTQQVVGCGPALDGVEVSIHDEAGEPLPERHLGQIVVRGSSVAAGYISGQTATGITEWRDGALWTGDAGFMDGGQLYVIGRLGDAMKVRGRTLFAEDIEGALVEAGVPRLRVAVLLGAAGHGEMCVILLEQPDPSWTVAATTVPRRLTEGVTTVVLDVPRRSIQRTTSGKPKRRPMWSAYVAGDLVGTQVKAAEDGPTV